MTIHSLKDSKGFAYLRSIPMHLRLSGVGAAFFLVAFFLPSVSLFLRGNSRLAVSYFQLLQNGAVRLMIDDTRHVLSFSGAILFLVLTWILPIIMLALIGFYPRISRKISGRVISGATIVLAAFEMAAAFLIPTRLIPGSFLAEAGLSSGELFFTNTGIANLIVVLAILIMVFALFGTIGIVIRLRMLTYPYFLWLIVFTILPLLLIVFYAFFAKTGAGTYGFTLDGFKTLMVDRIVETKFYGITMYLQEYFSVFLRSLDYAIWTTIGCLVVAYPLAYALASRTRRLHADSSLLLMFFVLPMWINTMLRTYAWRAFFGQTGVLNQFLLSMHLISDPILFLKLDFLSDFIIKLVLVNDFLPFMLLPIYSVLVKLDENVSQAAHDLGANSFQTFRKVVFPLSMPGVISGIQMVFMPSLTFYMIPDIISEGSVSTIGMTVQTFILSESTTQQQAGNVLSLLLLLFVLITMGILRNSDKDTGGGGMIL